MGLESGPLLTALSSQWKGRGDSRNLTRGRRAVDSPSIQADARKDDKGHMAYQTLRSAQMGGLTLLALWACDVPPPGLQAESGIHESIEVDFDIEDVVQQQRLRYAWEGDRLVEFQPAYRVRVDDGAFEFVARHRVAPSAPVTDRRNDPAILEGTPARIETVSIRRGTNLRLGSGAVRLGEHGEALFDRGVAVERLKNRPEGVEQSWIFDVPPDGAGPMEVRVEVSGLTYEGQTDQGHHFFGTEGTPGLRYGRAYWVDAGGARTEVAVRFDGQLVIEVPDDLVRNSVYPAVLDPLVLAEIEPDRAVTTIAALAQIEPDVAFGGSTFLAVWADQRDSGRYDIYGSRITAAGAIQDPNGIPIATAEFNQREPAVAYNGTDFLVVWSDGRDPNNFDIYGQIVTGAGALSGSEIVISNSSTNEIRPHVAALGSDWMVVWEDVQGGTPKVYAARIGATGSLVDAAFAVNTSGMDRQEDPDIACDGTNCLVVWEDGSVPNEDIHAARITTGQTVVDSSAIQVKQGGNRDIEPAVAYDGSTNYLVVWQDFSPPGAYSIFFNRVEAATGTVADAQKTVVADLPVQQRLPEVDFDGTNFFVTWTDPRRGVGDDLLYTRVSTSGLTLEVANGRNLDKTGGDQGRSAIASGGGVVTVVNEVDDTTGKNIDFSQRVPGSGAATSRTSRLLSQSTQRFNAPASVFVQGGYVILYTDFEGNAEGGSDIKWVHIDYRGRRRGGPQDITNQTDVTQDAPAIAYAPDQDQILMTWSDRSAGRWQIRGVRMDVTFNATVGTLDRTILDSTPIEVSDGTSGDQNRSRIAYNEDENEYLVVWSDSRSGNSGTDVFGSRITTGGVDLDTSDFRISDAAAPGSQSRPDVASDGTDYLVVWSDEQGGTGTPDVYGAIVTGAGSPGADFVIASAADSQSEPRTIYDFISDRYFAVWTDQRGIALTGSDIRGRVVSTTGTLLLSEEILADSGDNESRPALALVNNDKFLVSFATGTDKDRLAGVRTDLAGNLECSFDIATEPGRKDVPSVAAPPGPYSDGIVSFVRFDQSSGYRSQRVRARRIDVINGPCVP